MSSPSPVQEAAKSDICAAILHVEQSPEKMKVELEKLKRIIADYESKL